MKTVEELRLAALISGRDFCDKNDTELTTVAEYAPLKTAIDLAIKKVINARAINMQNLTSYAAAKQETQKFMVNLVFSIMLRSAVKAHEANKFEIEAALSFPISYITHNDDAGIGVKCEEIKNKIKENLTVLTNILPLDITNMEDAIAAHQEILAVPKEARSNRKAYGTGRINSLLNDADIPKINIGKIIHSYFPELAIGWDEAIKVGKSSGIRHTSLAIMFLVEGTTLKLKNVNCTITNGAQTFVCKSSKLGWVRYFSLTTDKWMATCQLETFETFIISGIEIDANHTEKHIIFLKKESALNDIAKKSNLETTTGTLNITCFDKETNLPKSGALVKVPVLSHTFTTKSNGHDLIQGIAQGNYQGTVTCPNYQSLDFDFNIEIGKTTTLQLYLEKES